MCKSIWYCHAVLFSSPNFHFFIFSTYLPYRFTASSFQKHPTWIFLNHSSTAHFFLTVDHIFNHVSDNIATSFKCCIFFCVFIIHFIRFTQSLVSAINQTMLFQFYQHFIDLLIPQVHQIHNFFNCKDDIGNSIFITPCIPIGVWQALAIQKYSI